MNFRFVYRAVAAESVRRHIRPLMADLLDSEDILLGQGPVDIHPGDHLLLYVSDDDIKEVLPKIARSGAVMSILPHPDALQACTGMGVDYNLEKALAHLREKPEVIEGDVLYCNGRPVFNTVVVGDAFQLVTSRLARSMGLWRRTQNLVRRFLRLQPFTLEIVLKNGKTLRTSAAGIVVVLHGRSSLLSRIMLDDSKVNDGMLHAFVFSPRSVMDLLHFALKSWRKKKRIPDFAAQIKTARITFNCPAGFEYAEDGNTMSSRRLDLQVEPKQIRFIPGAHLRSSMAPTQPTEVYKLDVLPTSEAACELVRRRLPIIRHASAEEFKELFQMLRNNARLKGTFLVLMVLSTILATFGLFANSSPVVIGAMILAPLMSPIISLSMATLRQDRKLSLESLTTIFTGLALSMAFAVVITLVTPLHTPNNEILARTRPNLLDLGIAVVSGIAGAYAHAREEVAKTLAGVAIAVVLVPPSAVAGIGLGWLDLELFSGAMLLLITNLAGIVLAATLTFLLLGFSPLKLATRGVIFSLLFAALLSIPLALGFKRMVYEHQIIQRIEAWETENITVKDVKVQRLQPLELSVRIVASGPLEEAEIQAIKRSIEELIGSELSLEITLAIRR